MIRFVDKIQSKPTQSWVGDSKFVTILSFDTTNFLKCHRKKSNYGIHDMKEAPRYLDFHFHIHTPLDFGSKSRGATIGIMFL